MSFTRGDEMSFSKLEEIRITKMHGNGNDFVLVDEFDGEVIPESKKPEFVRAVCHRRFGIGADGMLFLQRSDKADAKFRYFNSDGSEAGMCGNGIRCFSRYIVEEGYAEEGLITVETRVGVIELKVRKDKDYMVRVNMGEVKTKSSEIPASIDREDFWGVRMKAGEMEFDVFAVNTGVPHAVVFVENLDTLDIAVARDIRYSELFPEGTNVNFVSPISEKEIRIRTYERGVEDETLSCGTGSVASAYVALKLGYVKEPVKVLTRGGELIIEFDDEIAYMTGSANRVFDGILRLSELRYI
jgi:diaminopimelate epimerase